ncbi:MAG: hypothetical protein P8J59_10690 [Phycisphaerales bacterium]|nr:hypothetical protein [Phycisphaerales bacterium]
MPLLRSVRRWFTRDQPLDLKASNLIAEPVSMAPKSASTDPSPKPTRTISVSSMVDELDRAEAARFPENEPTETTTTPEISVPGNPLASMTRIEGAISKGRDAQDRIAEAVSSVPQAVSALDQAAARQQHLLEVLQGLASHQRDDADRSNATLGRVNESIERSTEVAGLVQRQLDANHQITLETANRLEQVGHAILESNQTSRAVGEAMTAMIGEIRDRDQAQEERSSVLQGWIVASVVGCIAASAAALALAWAVLGLQG